HSLAPSTQIQFMNNQSKKCLSEQHCRHAGHFYFRHFHLVLFGVHCDHVFVVLMMLNILCD
ncbi:hypothetical protein NUK49_22040, partial [Aeromonas caviae]|uniref:hypothetical protein n=1 Tax=Aeromonas caviae TaxID=648 RepID=UPI00214F5D23